MKNVKEKVKLNAEEAKMVAGGFSFGSTGLASLSSPTVSVYAQVANSTVSLKPVASDFNAPSIGTAKRFDTF